MADFLVVIRSGATDYDRQGRIRGTLDIPLCAEGIADAERAAAKLATPSANGLTITAIYTSSAACAVETASIVGRAVGLRPRTAAELENLDQGLWQGMLVEDLRRKQPRLYRQWQDNPWSVSPPEGELLEEACGRVEDALVKLLKRHAAATRSDHPLAGGGRVDWRSLVARCRAVGGRRNPAGRAMDSHAGPGKNPPVNLARWNGAAAVGARGLNCRHRRKMRWNAPRQPTR